MRARRSRVRRVAKWAGLMACVAVVTLGAVSVWYYFSINYGESMIHLMPARVGISHSPRWQFDDTFSFGRVEAKVEWWFRSINEEGSMWHVSMPLWMPLLPLAALTGFLWYRDRRPQPGHCANCGYNLHGLTEPRCPECGAGFGGGG